MTRALHGRALPPRTLLFKRHWKVTSCVVCRRPRPFPHLIPDPRATCRTPRHLRATPATPWRLNAFNPHTPALLPTCYTQLPYVRTAVVQLPYELLMSCSLAPSTHPRATPATPPCEWRAAVWRAHPLPYGPSSRGWRAMYDPWRNRRCGWGKMPSGCFKMGCQQMHDLTGSCATRGLASEWVDGWVRRVRRDARNTERVRSQAYDSRQRLAYPPAKAPAVQGPPPLSRCTSTSLNSPLPRPTAPAPFLPARCTTTVLLSSLQATRRGVLLFRILAHVCCPPASPPWPAVCTNVSPGPPHRSSNAPRTPPPP